MTLDQARQHLMAYADGELDARLSREFEAALGHYPHLRVEVEQCRALRRALHRALNHRALPAGIEDRLRARLRDQQRTVARRSLRLWAPVLALAAAIALFLLLRPLWRQAGGNDAAAQTDVTLVSVAEFATVHLRCAVHERQHPLEASGFTCAADAKHALQRQFSYAVAIPELLHSGYALDGVGECIDRPGLHAVHAYYRFPGQQPEVLSIFSCDHRVKLKDGHALEEDCIERTYEIGTFENVTVLKWNGQTNSFAICAVADAGTLRELADTINIARALFRDAGQFASAALERACAASAGLLLIPPE
ncbi:MAG: hypothetical protein HRF50_07740 [Phycisphaerae bacterium]|jgi:anti-sigma factor RsiW